MTLLCRMLHVTVRRMPACSVPKLFRGCLYGQPKCSKDLYLIVRDDFWLSWTTGQPLLRALQYTILTACC